MKYFKCGIKERKCFEKCGSVETLHIKFFGEKAKEI
jgi:hypothetical protein